MASQSIYAPKVADNVSLQDEDRSSEEDVAPPNPYLKRPLLYLTGVDGSISDRDLANSVFEPFVPVRLNINRNDEAGETLRGTIEFQTLEKAERAFATVRIPQLSINEDESLDPKPSAKPRLVKQLPHATEDVNVYDIFRPYGPLASALRILTNPQGHHTGFRGMAIVTFYHEEDAQKAQTEMHCAEVEGKTISVSIDNVARRPSAQGARFSPSAAPFVPGTMAGFRGMNAAAPAFQPPHRSSSGSQSPQIATNPHSQQNGPMMAVPGTNLQYSASAATYIDPCNLFCKNLDPSIDSNQLFLLFKSFGKIVSARVMREDNGASREFGFVSFKRPEDANRALQAMNQTMHGSKQMIVRLHEPKTMRQEKLSHKFGNSYVGSLDSPNEAGGPSSEANGSSGGSQSPGPFDRTRERRSSNSYFRAAASGENGSGVVDMDQLKAMSSSVRIDVVRGEFSRRVKGIKGVEEDKVEDMVAELSKMKLADAIVALNDSTILAERVSEIQAKGHLPSLNSAGQQSEQSAEATTPAETERDRLLAAVSELLPLDSPAEDITDLLVGLPKKERAMALFNQEYLRKKVEEAKLILDIGGEEEGEGGERATGPSMSPLTRENVALASTSPVLNQDGGERTKVYTLADLAAMPAAEIIKLANSSQSAGLPLPKADGAVTTETDDFIDGLKTLAPHDQKQKLGDQLFKKIRTFGVKGAPKITIALLDSEDLRSLAHLMNSYPECLREKVLLKSAK